MYNYKAKDGAYIGMNLPISSANIDETGLMLSERAKFTAKNGAVVISTANSNLDGSGDMSTLITGASYGTIIKRIIIKGQGAYTREGVVRFFHFASDATRLWKEVEIPAVTQSSRDHSLCIEIDEYFYLKSGASIKVSTELNDAFVVTVDAADYTYPA